MADFGSKITNIFIMKHIKRSIDLNKFRGSLSCVLMTVGATSGARTAYPSEVPEFTPDLCRVCVAHSVVFNVVLLLILFHLSFFFLAIVFSVLRFMASDNLFGIYNFFFNKGTCIVLFGVDGEKIYMIIFRFLS